MSDNGEDDDDDILAAEYVIGVLTPSETAYARARLSHSTTFQESVKSWEERLVHLALTAPPKETGSRVWSNIRDALHIAALAQTSMRSETLSLLALDRSLRFWRKLALGAMAGAATAVIVGLTVSVYVLSRPASTRYIAAVSASGQQPALLISINPETKDLLIIPISAEKPKGRSLELWLVPEGKSPVSLGLLQPNAETKVKASAIGSQMAKSPSAFAVSAEPEGGSPTGSPTGPILYSGNLFQAVY